MAFFCGFSRPHGQAPGGLARIVMAVARIVMRLADACQGRGAGRTGRSWPRRPSWTIDPFAVRRSTGRSESQRKAQFAHRNAACQRAQRSTRALHHDETCDHQPISQVPSATPCCSNDIETSGNTTSAHDEFESAPCADRLMRKFSMLKFFSCPSSQFSN